MNISDLMKKYTPATTPKVKRQAEQKTTDEKEVKKK